LSITGHSCWTIDSDGESWKPRSDHLFFWGSEEATGIERTV